MNPIRTVQLITLRSLESEWKTLHAATLKASVSKFGEISDECMAELDVISKNVSRVHELILFLEKPDKTVEQK